MVDYNSRIYTVYIHTNLKNGKRYVGITLRNPPCSRWGKFGEKYANEELRADIGKYGWNAFDHQIVERHLTAAKAAEKEHFWISLFNTTDPRFGYNKTSGGFGCAATKVVAMKISQAKKGKPHKGHKLSPETIEKIRAKNIGQKRSAEARANISNGHKGLKFSEETRNRMSVSQKKRQQKLHQIITTNQ